MNPALFPLSAPFCVCLSDCVYVGSCFVLLNVVIFLISSGAYASRAYTCVYVLLALLSVLLTIWRTALFLCLSSEPSLNIFFSHRTSTSSAFEVITETRYINYLLTYLLLTRTGLQTVHCLDVLTVNECCWGVLEIASNYICHLLLFAQWRIRRAMYDVTWRFITVRISSTSLSSAKIAKSATVCVGPTVKQFREFPAEWLFETVFSDGFCRHLRDTKYIPSHARFPQSSIPRRLCPPKSCACTSAVFVCSSEWGEISWCTHKHGHWWRNLSYTEECVGLFFLLEILMQNCATWDYQDS